MSTTFNPVAIGGGGYVTAIDISPDGLTKVVRTDVFGAYVWDTSTSKWRQVVTNASLPVADRVLGNNYYAVYDIKVAPTDSTRVYMVLPGAVVAASCYRSNDRATTWTSTGVNLGVCTVQSGGRIDGPKMAVDPNNADVVYIGNSAGGIFRTFDGGSSWAQISTSDVPLGSDPTIVFDPTSGTTGGRTNEVYISTGSNGVYESTDAGVTWARTTGGPTIVKHIVCSHDGYIFATEDIASKQNAWKYVSSTWTNLAVLGASTSNNYHCVACDPLNAGHVVFGLGSGNINRSDDYGATFYGFFGAAPLRTATDVPWLAWTNEDSMSSGDIRFDPLVSNRLWFVEGIGIWYTSPPASSANVTWTSQTVGNEELIVDDLIFPPGGKPLVACQDRAVFRIDDPTINPSTHGPARDAPIRGGWGLDYASSDPTFVVGVFNSGAADKSGYSSDGGVTWNQFGALAADFGLGGAIAAASTTNFVWAPAQGNVPSYTTDGGATWALGTFEGSPPAIGWGFTQFNIRHIVCADRVNIGTFYAYNNSSDRLYKSTDGGINWSLTGPAALFGLAGGAGTGGRLIAVPGKAGHLFFAVGHTAASNPHPYNTQLKRSTDAGVTWSGISGTQETWAIGFGKEAPGGSYPSIYIAGIISSVSGIYRSTDNCTSWERLTTAPFDHLDMINAIAGDMNTYGTFYFGFSGSGAGYGVEDAVTATTQTTVQTPGGAGAPLRRRAQYESYDTIVRRQKIREIEALKAAILARGPTPKLAEKAREFIHYNDGMSIKAMISELVQAQQELEEEDEVMRVFAILH